MLKIINDYLNEFYDYESTSLDFSCTRLELSLKKEEVSEGSFFIYAGEEKPLSGKLITNGFRMECLTDSFAEGSTEIFYRFDARGLAEGEVIKGEITIISTRGEYEIPYVASVERTCLNSSLGPIKNLFHFTNLAKTNWAEAAALFYTPDFIDILRGNDLQYKSLYRGLSNWPDNEQNVEEFLLKINKKMPVEYTVEQQEILLKGSQDEAEAILKIFKKGWGYTLLQLDVEGGFLQLSKQVLQKEDFTDDYCEVVVSVKESCVHAGRNFGAIRLNTPDSVICIEAVYHNVSEKHMVSGHMKQKMKALEIGLMRAYLDYQRGQLRRQEWFSHTNALIEEYISLDERNVTPWLYHAHFYLTQDQYQEAKWALDRVESMLDGEKELQEVWCYYLYLTALLHQDHTYYSEVKDEISQAYQDQQTNWRIAWLLLQMEEEYHKSVSKKWLFLEELYWKNCRSPVIYIEAIHLMEEKPSLLMKLDDFTMQLLHFALRQNMLPERVLQQLQFLAGRCKEYSDKLFHILIKAYQTDSDPETLHLICMLLMRGNKTDPLYFKWYEAGVRENLRITLLYEYYMMSLPPNYQGKIPKMVLMYFAYHSNLDSSKKAFLYELVIGNREEYAELLHSYQIPMESFVLEQLKKGKINKRLSVLYNEVLNPDMLTPELAEKLVPILFTVHIKIRRDDIIKAVIVYDKCIGEIGYPVVGKEAYIPVYGNEYALLLEDRLGRRFAREEFYHVEKLMRQGKLMKQAAKMVNAGLEFALYLSANSASYASLTMENASMILNIVESVQVMPQVKRELSMKLLHYYFEHDCTEQLQQFLEGLTDKGFSFRERSEIVRYMIVREMYDKALDWVKHSGLDGLEPKIIVRLCSRIIARQELEEDKELTGVIYFAYRKGKYDENILKYLITYFNGPIQEMRNIWKAARGFLVDTRPLCERMIIQMLCTGSYVPERMEIFEDYIKGTAGTDILKAYLSRCAFEYFVGEELAEVKLLDEVQRLSYQGEEINRMTKLAYLKYFAENKQDMEESRKKAAVTFLHELLKEEIYFSFFQEYLDIVPELALFHDRCVLEYKTLPGRQVHLHYLIGTSLTDSDGEQYCQEMMKEMYGGIYSKSFVLFYGECLQYYITEEVERLEQLTESKTLQRNDSMPQVEESRYGMINDIGLAGAVEDIDTALQLIEEFREKEYMTDSLFSIV